MQQYLKTKTPATLVDHNINNDNDKTKVVVCKDEKDWIGNTKCDNNNFTKERIRDFKNM